MGAASAERGLDCVIFHLNPRLAAIFRVGGVASVSVGTRSQSSFFMVGLLFSLLLERRDYHSTLFRDG